LGRSKRGMCVRVRAFLEGRCQCLARERGRGEGEGLGRLERVLGGKIFSFWFSEIAVVELYFRI